MIMGEICLQRVVTNEIDSARRDFDVKEDNGMACQDGIA